MEQELADQTDQSQFQEQVETPDEDASFEEGFNATKGIETPEPEPEPLIAGYTEEQLKEMFQRVSEIDKIRERENKVFGTLGNMKQAIDALRNQPAPQQGGVKLNAGALKRLESEFPEMAELLREDLSDAFTGSQSGPSSVDLERIFTERLSQQQRESARGFEVRLVRMKHKDWDKVIHTPEFAQWKGSLRPDELRIVNDSWDADEVSESLDRFKSWRDTAVQNRQNRQAKLNAAITPKGGRQSASSMEQDPFVAGFKSVRGG